MGERRVGYVPGVYDLFHIGHLNVLRNARAFCDYLIAGVVTDEVAERAKGALPIVPLDERLDIVASVRYVDEAVVEDARHKLEMWERLRFDVIIKGDDWEGTERGAQLERDMGLVGVDVAYVPYTQRTSSTLLRQVLHRTLETPEGPEEGLYRAADDDQRLTAAVGSAARGRERGLGASGMTNA